MACKMCFLILYEKWYLFNYLNVLVNLNQNCIIASKLTVTLRTQCYIIDVSDKYHKLYIDILVNRLIKVANSKLPIK